MPILKPISGHTSARPIMLYLTKKNRAVAVDYINIDAPFTDEDRTHFDWAAEMDETRRECGNDRPWRGRRARTYKHYVISPDPQDRIGIDTLRDLATSWAEKHFGEHEIAIVYHDDNGRGIPHAHVVVNNTSLETLRRLQDPDPRALNASLQEMAAERNLRHFCDGARPAGVAARADRGGGRVRPRTLQREHVSRAEAELVAKGAYSWTADIRARVRIARTVARSEAEFRGALSAMGVEMTNNSPKASRRDWVYSLANHPTRRVSGEKLGLSYGKERLLSSFALGGAGHLPDASERGIARIAKGALEVGDLGELDRLSRALSLIEANCIRSVRDLNRLKGEGTGAPDGLVAFIEKAGILPERAAAPAARTPASKAGSGPWGIYGGLTATCADTPARASQQRTCNERGVER